MREAKGARRYNTLITLTYEEAAVDEYGKVALGEDTDVLEVYAYVRQMSASKTMMTFQLADVVGLEIELREPGVIFNGLRYDGHDVHFTEPEPIERGRILRISGWYQVDR